MNKKTDISLIDLLKYKDERLYDYSKHTQLTGLPVNHTFVPLQTYPEKIRNIKFDILNELFIQN